MPGPLVLPPELDDNLLVLQLRAQWDVETVGRGECSWSFVCLRIAIVDQKAGLAEQWMENVKPSWMARRPPEWRFTRVLVEDRWPATTVPLEIPINEFGPEGDFNGAPVQVTPVVVWNTSYSGRSYRGRSYWGQIRAEDLQGSSYSSALYSNLQDFGLAMFDQFLAGPILGVDPKLAIVSRQHNLVPEPKGRYALVTNFQTPRYIGLQRRRLRYYSS